MQRGTKNKVRTKFKMNSPLSYTTPSKANYDFTKSTTGNAVDANRDNIKTQKKIETVNNQINANNRYDYSGNIVGEGEPKGIDRFIDKPIMELLGLTKEQREARKIKKNKKVEDAKKAIGEGTETLKQAKLVKRTKKKEDRKAKRNIKKTAKDKKKLAKFREKNPVTGKEAINLLANQTKKENPNGI
jgi:hypothetical protein|tara:strand:- start:1917 stop:2477 length:561 start_codon:yes stop_codon:yes gene_type:complete